MEIEKLFNESKNKIQEIYPRMKIRVPMPDPKNGRKNVKIMFINERPGIKGAVKYVSFDNEDNSARNFKELFETLGIDRKNIFITNACIWCPDKVNKNPKTDRKEIDIEILKKQIDIMKPKLIVTLGNSALLSIKLLLKKYFGESEQLKGFKLKKQNNPDLFTLGTKSFLVYPLYHTSQRGMNSPTGRTLEKQKKDWLKIKEILKRGEKKYIK